MADMPNTIKPTKIDNSTEPWKPALILKYPDTPGFRRKWVRTDIVDRFKAEGWRLVANVEAVKTPKTIIDGAPLDTSVQKRELVLMELPETRAKARDAYYKNLTEGALDASVDEFKAIAGADTGKSYGEVKVIKGGA